jgi:ABC-2 type transport system ATP-binding protein
MISCVDLGKTYDSKVDAVTHLSLDVRRGELLTIVGRNGAGKTTLLRMISTVLLPSYGHVYVGGYDVVDEVREVRDLIAVVPQDVGTHNLTTPWDYAFYYARLRGMPKSEAKESATRALRDFGIWDLRDRLCSSLSGGEKKRAIIAAIIASNAEILLLDEPTAGLDAIARREVWASLRTLAMKGKTILLTTHNFEEAEMISDKIAIINKGKLVATGTVSEIRRMVQERYRVVISTRSGDSHLNAKTLAIGDRRIAYFVSGKEALGLVSQLVEAGQEADVAPVSLEDVFVRLIEEL